MTLLQILQRLAVVTDRANAFINQNAKHLLPDQRSKMIDFCTISLMHYEDHVFHWDQIKNIVTLLVDKKINNVPSWHIDISQSTSDKVVIKSDVGDCEITMPIETFMMTMQLAVH